MIFEGLLAGIAVLAAAIVAVFSPEFQRVLQQIWKQATIASDVQTILVTLAPYLTNPLVLLLALAFAAVCVPLIEETLKPAAVWLLGRRLRSPAEGFALGALCGAGFAMLEGMQAANGMAQMLGIGLVARAASSLMHVTASGLMGWGIASARLEKRHKRLAGTFLLSVGIHGLWNGSVVLAVFGALRFSLQETSPDLISILLVTAGMGILGFMLIMILVLLPIINLRLRPAPQAIATPRQSDIIAPL
jgi:RsiW-degrading membrane proteinase PrsW (M82 family)